MPNLDRRDGVATDERQSRQHMQPYDLQPELTNRVLGIDFTCRLLRLWVDRIVVGNMDASKSHDLGDEEGAA
jgi:hypothetical protein